jgi:hypothetical protein
MVKRMQTHLMTDVEILEPLETSNNTRVLDSGFKTSLLGEQKWPAKLTVLVAFNIDSEQPVEVIVK